MGDCFIGLYYLILCLLSNSCFTPIPSNPQHWIGEKEVRRERGACPIFIDRICSTSNPAIANPAAAAAGTARIIRIIISSSSSSSCHCSRDHQGQQQREEPPQALLGCAHFYPLESPQHSKPKLSAADKNHSPPRTRDNHSSQPP